MVAHAEEEHVVVTLAVPLMVMPSGRIRLAGRRLPGQSSGALVVPPDEAERDLPSRGE